jgi:NTP pyrophosphatase (non-canonical NTP hydrolase)
MAKTIAEMTAEIRAVNIEKGWRPADGGPGENTWGDYVALLHSEISEALEAYRDHRLADATVNTWSGGAKTFPGKPEGVGSEFADVLIRFLDMCDVFGIQPFDMDYELPDVGLIPLRGETFGDHMAWLHHCAAVLAPTWMDGNFAGFLRAIVSVADQYGIDLDAEYERKIAYNRTRGFQHGGRTLADNTKETKDA